MLKDLRIHVAGLGYEVQRIVKPAVDLRADRLHLLTDPPKAKLKPYYDAVLRHLKSAKIECVVTTCEVWVPNVVVGEMGKIAERERDHRVSVNLGTGPKTCAIGGSLAAMLWGFEAYYPKVDHDAPDVDLKDDKPVTGITTIPSFRLEAPSAEVLSLLELLDEKRGRPARKKEVVERLRDRRFLKPKEASSAQSDQNYADRVLKRALEWGFLDSEGEGRRRRLKLNERGVAGRKMFGHLRAAPADE